MIEVGEYVRTKTGFIIKADFIDFESLTIGQKRLCYEFEDIERMEEFIKTEIVKHSKNIIDLICEGDYVNGKIVRAVYLEGATHYIKIGEPTKEGIRIYNEDIKSVVAKEQFANIEYKV